MHQTPTLSPAQFKTLLMRQIKPFVGLGAAEDDVTSEWGSYIEQLRDSVDAAMVALGQSYDELRDFCLQTNRPFLETPQKDPNGALVSWTKDLDAQYANVHAMGMAIVTGLTDCLEGRRETYLTEDGWGVQLLPTDPYQILVDEKQMPVLVQNPIAGQVGVGVVPPPVLIAAIVAKLLITAGVLYIVYTAINAITDIILAILDKKRAEAVYGCLDKHTPEQCAQAHQQILAQSEAQRNLEGQRKKEDPADKISGLAVTLLGVAAGATALYFGIKYLPPLLDERQARTANPAGGAGRRKVKPCAHCGNTDETPRFNIDVGGKNGGKWVCGDCFDVATARRAANPARDRRYTIQQEWTGKSSPQWVVRFSDKWIGSSSTREGATRIKKTHRQRFLRELRA